MKQKEIWLINLDPTIGAEIRKTRPCIILNDDSIGALPLKVVSPVTDYKEKYVNVPWMVRLVPDEYNKLKKPSVIDVFQMRCVSNERLIKRIGTITEQNLKEVIQAVKVIFGMS